MKINQDVIKGPRHSYALMLSGILLVLMLSAYAADAQAADTKPVSDVYQTFYLTNATQQNDANDVQTALRNMLPPKTRIYYSASDSALSVLGTAEDIQQARKIVADLDKPRKTYRLTYTISESDGGKSTGSKKFVLMVTPGAKAMLKQGSRVPLVTGTTEGTNAAQNSQVQYIDVGLNIDATLDGSADGLRLRSKVEQSMISEEKSSVGIPDPVIRQATVEGNSILVQGKPFLLGALDVPGSMRHWEIEVVSEVVK